MQTRGIESPPSTGLRPAADKVVLMMDLVSSVVHMADDEAQAVSRWHGFVTEAVALVQRGGGQVVKSLGDGLLAVFDEVGPAVTASQGLHALALRLSLAQPTEHPLQLRISLNATPVYACEFDIFGHGVNVAARMLSLAGPCETVASSSVQAQLAGQLDVQLEDLGDCYLKHLAAPVRAYRVRDVGGSGVRNGVRSEGREFAGHGGAMARRVDDGRLRPSVSVLPFTSRSTAHEALATGALIADAVTVELSGVPELRVISSWPAGVGSGSGAPRLAFSPGAHQPVDYVLSGSYSTVGERLLVTAELVDTRRSSVLWMGRFEAQRGDLLQLRCLLAQAVSQAALAALVAAEVQKLYSGPLSRMDSSSLLLGGMALMHYSKPGDFRLSQRALATVADRHGQMAAPWAWSALWHVIKEVRGWSSFPEKDAQLTLEQASRALEIEPEHPVALGVEAYARCQCPTERAQAQARLRRTLDQEAAEPLSWLSKRIWTRIRQRERAPTRTA